MEGAAAAPSANHAVPTAQLVPRSYQSALIALAEERNIIACLPTGSGKTLIATKLSEKFFEPVKMKRLKIVFVTCTLPLLKQQLEVFQKHTVFQCNAFSGTGTEKFDTDNKKAFKEKYESCEVLLMTPQYFYNLLSHGFMSFEDICLLIFDECHHTVSGNPMNQIMRMYSQVKELNAECPLPRVLGLSATVVAKNVKLEVLPEEVASIERRLDCVAVSCSMLEEVGMYSTNAQVECVKCSLSDVNLPGYNKEDYLAPITKVVEFFRSLPQEFKYDSEHKRAHPIEPNQWLFNGTAVGDSLATMLEECCLLCPVLGPFGVIHLAVVKIRYLKDKIQNICGEEKGILKMYRVALTALMHFMVRARTTFPMSFENGNIEHLLSNKVLRTLDILLEYRSKVDTEDALCGLLFVNRRTIAIALKEILFHLKKSNPSKYGFISPAVVVGSNARNKISSIDRVKAKEQAEIISRFRSKELNLLICTSVLEEGLDVPSCNLVIRFDGVKSFGSYVQSMGRARKKDARYLVLLDGDEYETGRSQMATFEKVNKLLNEKLRKHLTHVMKGIETDEDEEFEDEEICTYIPDFAPNGMLAARITAYTCVALCYRYANAVRRNEINCWDWYDKYDEEERMTDGKTKYRASITLPPGSAVGNLIIQGDPMPNKKFARKAVFMKACMEIHAGGGFDYNFLPRTSKESGSELNAAMTALQL